MLELYIYVNEEQNFILQCITFQKYTFLTIYVLRNHEKLRFELRLMLNAGQIL